MIGAEATCCRSDVHFGTEGRSESMPATSEGEAVHVVGEREPRRG